MTPISLFLAPHGSAGPPPGPPPKEPEGFALWLAASGPPPGQSMQTGEALRPQPIAGDEELDSRSAETDPQAAALAIQPALAWVPVNSAPVRLEGLHAALFPSIGQVKASHAPPQAFMTALHKLGDPAKLAQLMSMGSLIAAAGSDAPSPQTSASTEAGQDTPLFMGRREMGDAAVTGREIPIGQPEEQPIFMGRREIAQAQLIGREIPVDQPQEQPIFMGRRELGTAPANGLTTLPADSPEQPTAPAVERLTGAPIQIERAAHGVSASLIQAEQMPPMEHAEPQLNLVKPMLDAEPTLEAEAKEQDHLLHGLKSESAHQAEPASAQSGSQDQPKDDGQRRLEAMRQASDIIQARQPMRVAVEIDRMDLGLIKLEMSHDRVNEAVEASFEARRPETRDALVMAQPDLRRALDEKGVSLSRFDVSAETSQGSPQRDGRPSESGQRTAPQPLTASAVEAPISRSTSRHAGLEVIA
jgi:hypothetical protein